MLRSASIGIISAQAASITVERITNYLRSSWVANVDKLR